MSDFIWILIASIYVAAVLALSFFLGKRGVLSPEGARKTVHILVSLTSFILAYGIDDDALRLLGPAVFIAVNAVLGIRSGQRLTGLVCYPLSLLILSAAMNLGYLLPSSLAAGGLVMGLGDGAAALVGMRWGRHRIGHRTLEGSLAMLACSFAVLYAIGGKGLYGAALGGAAVTAIEVLTPHGLDNVSVPLSAAFLSEVL